MGPLRVGLRPGIDGQRQGAGGRAVGPTGAAEIVAETGLAEYPADPIGSLGLRLESLREEVLTGLLLLLLLGRGGLLPSSEAEMSQQFSHLVRCCRPEIRRRHETRSRYSKRPKRDIQTYKQTETPTNRDIQKQTDG